MPDTMCRERQEGVDDQMVTHDVGRQQEPRGQPGLADVRYKEGK